MPITITIELLARPRCISSVGEADEGETFRSPRLPVLGEEDTGDAAETFENVAEVAFLGEFGDLIVTQSANVVPSLSVYRMEVTHIRNPQRSQVVPFVLPSHLLPRRRPAPPQMRRHVPASTSTQAPFLSRPVSIHSIRSRPRTSHRPHSPVHPVGSQRILERTLHRIMLPIADPALDLLILQLLLQTALIHPAISAGSCRAIRCPILPFTPRSSVLRILLPRHAGPEHDILAHARRVEARPRRVPLFEAELGPRAALGDTGVDGLADDGRADAPCRTDLFAGVVEGVRHDGFGAVFVRRDGLRGEGGGVVEFFVVGPVRAAVWVGINVGSGGPRGKVIGEKAGGEREGGKETYLAIFDMVAKRWFFDLLNAIDSCLA